MAAMEAGKLIAVIGDEDTVTGFLLAGVGERTAEAANFLVVKNDTKIEAVEAAFRNFTERDDVAIARAGAQTFDVFRRFSSTGVGRGHPDAENFTHFPRRASRRNGKESPRPKKRAASTATGHDATAGAD